MKYFVEYSDDYADNGGQGVDMFDTKQEALDFIQKRITERSSKLSCYTLIYGKILELKSVDVVTKIEAIE